MAEERLAGGYVRGAVAGASLAAVTDFMPGEGCTTLHARALVTNDASARILFRARFACAGDPYIDPGDGLF